MDILSSPIPHISISLAPPEEIPAEPYSPFANTTFTLSSDQEDAFRPFHLTPPPTHTSFVRQISPLRSSGRASPVEHAKETGKGLDRARFEAMLNATKAKPVVSKKDAVDLRKEVALKAHINRQAGRRALFLSKVLAPPSPAATVTPKTPPESPAIFHYSLPSPGLVSPIAYYESLHDREEQDGISPHTCQPWVEQVDFKLVNNPRAPRLMNSRPKQHLPSLEQISARLNSHRTRGMEDQKQRVSQTAPSTLSAQPRLVIGRLRMPVRSSTTTPTIKITFPDEEEQDDYAPPVPPKSPLLTPSSGLEAKTLVTPRTRSASPTEFTIVNLSALNSRETRSSTMLSTLRRRTQSSSFRDTPHPNPSSDDADRKTFRRHSAPPESRAHKQRSGFEHPVLRLPGAF